MTLIKSPLPELKAMQQVMDQSLSNKQQEPVDETSSIWQPPIDVCQTDDGLVLLMDLPGVDQQQIDVQIEEEILIVQGERLPRMEAGADYQRQERPLGRFCRRFTVPKNVELGRIRANCEQGVLTVRLPLVDDSQVHHITVESADG